MKPFASTEGKVFFDAPNKRGKLTSYVCSGTALNSENQSVVWTAGHCVHDGAPPRVLENPHWQADFHKNWVFAPGYHVGMDCAGRPKCSAPLGYWRPRQGQVITLSGWSRYGSLLYDLGAVVLQKKNGHTLFDAIGGGQGIAFSQAVKATYWSFGYPAEAPFSGESLFYCRSGLQFRDRPVEIRVWKGKYVKAPQQIAGPSRIGIRCNMTGGSSGGGWLTRFDRTWGYVTGVNSTGDDKFMSSPYLGDAAANLWTAVRKR